MRWFVEKLTDTLAKRLFLLLWGALVVSHALAFGAVLMAMPASDYGPMGSRMARMPTFPSLPPTFRRPPEGLGEMRPPPPQEPGAEMPPPPEMQHHRERRTYTMPTYLVLLDYSVRLIVIALAAWFGSGWVTAPMRRLVSASQALGASIGQERTPSTPELDEQAGPREVRETAKVFNAMARQLRQQFRTRGLMVAAISHDLRTPLTRLRMRLEVMDAEPELQAKSVADVQEMNALIDKVLDVFRGEAQAEVMQRTDVITLLQSMVDDLAEQGLPVAFSSDEVTAVTEVQPIALRRVLGNLIGNALRYGERADVHVRLTTSELIITVDDQGPGIPEAHLEDVFQPFFRLESSRNQHTGGTGLGLYIARDLSQRQDGRLRLLNRSEGGLRAELALPRR